LLDWVALTIGRARPQLMQFALEQVELRALQQRRVFI
jgi:hypothetical protein